RVQMRLAKIAVARVAPLLLRIFFAWRAFGRQTGGDVFRALDFMLVPVAGKDIFLDRSIAEGIGAGFMGGAVGALRRVGVQSTRGAETLAPAAAAGEVAILFTHNIDINRTGDGCGCFARGPPRSTSRALK